MKIKNLFGRFTSLKVLMLFVAIGVWVNVLQNFGIIPSAGKQVYIVGGHSEISGDVNVIADDPLPVEVDNEVDVNIEDVIGHQVGCHQSYVKEGKQYWAIDTYKSNW